MTSIRSVLISTCMANIHREVNQLENWLNSLTDNDVAPSITHTVNTDDNVINENTSINHSTQPTVQFGEYTHEVSSLNRAIERLTEELTNQNNTLNNILQRIDSIEIRTSDEFRRTTCDAFTEELTNQRNTLNNILERMDNIEISTPDEFRRFTRGVFINDSGVQNSGEVYWCNTGCEPIAECVSITECGAMVNPRIISCEPDLTLLSGSCVESNGTTTNEPDNCVINNTRLRSLSSESSVYTPSIISDIPDDISAIPDIESDTELETLEQEEPPNNIIQTHNTNSSRKSNLESEKEFSDEEKKSVVAHSIKTESTQVEEEVEEEVEEDNVVVEIEYKGITYYKDSENFIYSVNDEGEPSENPVGYWKESTETIAFYKKK